MLVLVLACVAPEGHLTPLPEPGGPEPAPDVEAVPDSPERTEDTGDAAALWETDGLPTFSLTFAEADWEAALTALVPTGNCDDRPYLEADLVFRSAGDGVEERRERIGVRYRGHSALSEPNYTNNNRWGLKLAFSAFEDAPRFHGAERLSLLGTEGDGSLLRERLALEQMRAAGLPAPRANHAWVEVNGEPLGVFPLVEEADDKAWMEARFGEAGGSLYKVAGYCHGTQLDYAGDDVEDYAAFEAKAGTEDAQKAADLIPMLACLERDDDDAVRSCLETWIDRDAWLDEIAVDMVVRNVDGMAATAQNFLLYRPPEGRFVAYPYDLDLAYYSDEDDLIGASIWDLRPRWEPSLPVLPRRLRELYPDAYCDRVLAVAADPEPWTARLMEMAAQIDAAMQDDPFLSHGRWEDHVESLGEKIRDRFDAAADEARDCDIPPLPADPPEDTAAPESVDTGDPRDTAGPSDTADPGPSDTAAP